MNSWFNILTSQMSIFILFGSIWVLFEDVLSLSLSLTIFSKRHKTGWVRNATWNLTLSWRRPLSYRNQSIDLQSKSLDWFLHDNGLHHERVKWYSGRLKLYVGLEECLPNTSNVITLVVTTDLLLFRDIWIFIVVWNEKGTNEQRRFVCLFHFSRFFRATRDQSYFHFLQIALIRTQFTRNLVLWPQKNLQTFRTKKNLLSGDMKLQHKEW